MLYQKLYLVRGRTAHYPECRVAVSTTRFPMSSHGGRRYLIPPVPPAPPGFSPEQASDPGTSAHDMARIAAERPDLWPALAANPALYPDLRQWLGQVDD